MKVRITEFGPGCASVTGGVSPRVPAAIVDEIDNTFAYMDTKNPIAHLNRPKPLYPTILCRTGPFRLDATSGKEVWMAKASCSECGWWELASSFTALTAGLGFKCHKTPPHENCPLPKRRRGPKK